MLKLTAVILWAIAAGHFAAIEVHDAVYADMAAPATAKQLVSELAMPVQFAAVGK